VRVTAGAAARVAGRSAAKPVASQRERRRRFFMEESGGKLGETEKTGRGKASQRWGVSEV
jgi:hypothetical protein